ncbi:hypothetical protein [uncultured Croceitalea sp.]|uniref:hypothetical protein n=1 Tax=uncultured Croceitalea sp. TaxID=1798908 RepID=UPI0033063FA0
MKYMILIGILFGMQTSLLSQHANVESTFMNEKIKNQYTFFKDFESTKFSFFNLTSVSADYNFGRASESYLIDNFLFYQIKNRISLAVEGAVNQKVFIVAIGTRYTYTKNNFRFAFFPSYRISDKRSLYTRILLEYQSPISSRVSLYFRGQFNASTNFSGESGLSNLYRLGLQYKNIRMGLGTPWFKPLEERAFRSKHLGFFLAVTL